MSDVARDFVNKCLTVDASKRMTAEQCLAHPWLSQEASKPDAAAQVDLLPHVQANVKSRVTLKGTVRGMIFASRLKGKVEDQDPETLEMRRKVASYKEDAEAVSPRTAISVQTGARAGHTPYPPSAAQADCVHVLVCSLSRHPGKPFRGVRTSNGCISLNEFHLFCCMTSFRSFRVVLAARVLPTRVFLSSSARSFFHSVSFVILLSLHLLFPHTIVNDVFSVGILCGGPAEVPVRGVEKITRGDQAGSSARGARPQPPRCSPSHRVCQQSFRTNKPRTTV